MSAILDSASSVAGTTDAVDRQYAAFAEQLTGISGEIDTSSGVLQKASARVDAVVAVSEKMIQNLTASAGLETPDSPYIRTASDVAATISAAVRARRCLRCHPAWMRLFDGSTGRSPAAVRHR